MVKRRDVPFHPLASDTVTLPTSRSPFIARNINLGGLGGINLDARFIRPAAAESGVRGAVHLVKKLLFSTASSAETNTNDVVNINFIDAMSGGTVRETIPIFCPSHNLGGSPLSSTDHFSFVWEPSAPIIVPSGWRVETDWNSPIVLESAPFSVMAFGWRSDEHEVRSLGYDVGTAASQSDRNWIQRGLAPGTDTTTELCPRRAGKAIFISDILLVMSPTSGSATVELETNDGRDIFRWVTGAPTGQPIIRAIKTRIFIDNEGAGSPISNGFGLQVTSTNCGGRFSIAVLGRYIDFKDVPDNAWWSCVSPGIPTPAITPSIGRVVKAAPGRNRSHIVEGFELAMVRDGSSPLSNNVFALTYGTTAPASGTSNNFTTGGNVLMSPVFSLFGRDEQLAVGIDEVHMQTAINAAVLFESMGGVGGIGTPATAGDIIDTSCTVWGRTTDNPTFSVAPSYEGG